MAEHRDQKVIELIKHTAAEFILHEASPASLITVTDVRLSDRMTRATILITVFPESKEEEALDFVKRKRTQFKEYLTEHSRMRSIPFIDFEIDLGEKNRQLIDTLSAT